MHQILRSPELGRKHEDARPYTTEELENSLAQRRGSGDNREGPACSRIVDNKEVRDGGGAKAKTDSR